MAKKRQDSFVGSVTAQKAVVTQVAYIYDSASWSPTERDVAIEVVKELENRRVLYNDYELELPERVLHSVLEMRQFLHDKLLKLREDGALAGHIRAMRAACRKFLDTAGDGRGRVILHNSFQGGAASWTFFTALGELRSSFGLSLAMLLAAYDLSCEPDLGRILPANPSAEAAEINSRSRVESPAVPHGSSADDLDDSGRYDISEIASRCQATREGILAGQNQPNSHYEGLVMKVVKADVFKGLEDDPLAKVHLGSKLRGLPRRSLTLGSRGEEVRYFGVRAFPPGSVVGLFGVWPARDREVYAIVVDEKFPEFFGLYHRSLKSKKSAKQEWTNLARFENLRNEELGRALVAEGWDQLIPQRSSQAK